MATPRYPSTVLGKCMIERLFELDKNQKWLAAQCKTSDMQISLIVHGKSLPGNKVLFGISKSLNLDYDYLVELIEKDRKWDC